jgi:MFS family permease
MAESPAVQHAEGGGERRIERIAVVFVHGQGEQTPMTDVVELVESVWRTEPRATPQPRPGEAPVQPDETDLAGVYSQPVYDGDFSDQRRIRSLQVRDRQVDFHQFYWADLMKGNRFQHLWIWFTGLMRRDPREIPARIWPLRQTTMFLALAVGVWGVALGGLAAARLTNLLAPGAVILALVAGLLGVSSTISAHFPPKDPADKSKAARAARIKSILLLAVVAGLVGLLEWLIAGDGADERMFWIFVGAAIVLWLALTRWPPASRAALAIPAFLVWLLVLAVMAAGALGLLVSGGRLFVIADMSPAKLVGAAIFGVTVLCAVQLVSPKRRAAVFSLGLLLALAALASHLMPSGGQGASLPALAACLHLDAAGQDAMLTKIYQAAMLSTLAGGALLAVAGWWLNESFLAPVMTDSARMFSNSPVNIPNQNAIRERGMKLLKSLHKAHGPQTYDRIIVLAHSLGTVVAYRLLAHYWGSVFETLNAQSDDAQEAAVTIQALANQIDPPGGPALPRAAQRALLPRWREAVRSYWKALNPSLGSASAWKISDFVTIGSPLTYAALLMEETDRNFKEQVEVYKRYPTSPPQVISPGRGSVFLQGKRPYHAALFAATCWTNLYFPNKGLANGDLIGGPLHEGSEPGASEPVGKSLGPGILDVNLEHDNSVQGFTHSEYWRWPDRAKRLLRPFPQSDESQLPPPHVAAMRDALNLFDDVGADGRLLDPVKSYPNSVLPTEAEP